MVRDNKLEEDYHKLDTKKSEEKIKENEKRIDDLKKRQWRMYWNRLRIDSFYVIIISLMFGFSLWAWFPSQFTWFRVMAFGMIWWLLFEELKLHKMFKQEYSK